MPTYQRNIIHWEYHPRRQRSTSQIQLIPIRIFTLGARCERHFVLLGAGDELNRRIKCPYVSTRRIYTKNKNGFIRITALLYAKCMEVSFVFITRGIISIIWGTLIRCRNLFLLKSLGYLNEWIWMNMDDKLLSECSPSKENVWMKILKSSS